MTLRSVLLAGMVIGLIAGCGESKQPASSSPSATTPPVATETTPPAAPPAPLTTPPAAESGTVPAEPAPPAAAQVEEPKNLVARKLL